MKISVITSTYNNEKTLPRTIESVLSQTMEDFEYILVNHGSTDRTEDVIDRYMEKDRRIKKITMGKNEGYIGKALNTGIEGANGKYLCFIDGDDVYLPNFLKYLYDSVENGDYDMGICGSSRVYDTGEEFLVDTISASRVFLTEEDYIQLPEVMNETPTRYFTVCWNKMIKKSYLLQEGLKLPEDTLVHGDGIFLLECYKKKPKLFCGNEVGIQWTQQKKSTSFGTYRPAYFEEMMEVVSLYLEIFQEAQGSEEAFASLQEKLIKTVVNPIRLESIEHQEERDAEKRRWEAHPVYQGLLQKRGK